MKKPCLATLAIFALIFSSLFLNAHGARACGVKMPETLLSLYRTSEVIVTAEYVGETLGAITEDEETYQIVEATREYNTVRTLKGEAPQSIALKRGQWVPKTRETSPDEVAEEDGDKPDSEEPDDGDYGFPNPKAEPGDTVLLFLIKNKESNEFDLVDGGDGVKVLPTTALDTYTTRILELNDIFRSEKPDGNKIVDWLVTLAGDRETRWEGTYELLLSFHALEAFNEAKERPSTGEEASEESYYNDGLETGRTMLFAKLTNDHHKDVLERIFKANFAAEETGAKAKEVRGDNELMNLVTRWGSTETTDLLVARLRTNDLKPYETFELMSQLATMVDDEELEDIAERYSDIHYEDDTAVVTSDEDDKDQDETEKSGTPTDTKTETNDDESEAPKIPANKTASVAPVEPAVAKPTITYGTVKAELLSKYLFRLDNVRIDPGSRVSIK